MNNSLPVFKKKFNPVFNRYLYKKEKELVEIDPSIKPLFSHIRKIASKGKKIRPFLAHLSFKGFGGKDKNLILQAGISLELLHLFALIHDDIIDKDESRRGIVTVHKKFGLNSGILAGDLILSLADEAFPFSKKALNCYHQLKKEVIVGQYLDISSERKEGNILKTMEKEKTIINAKKGLSSLLFYRGKGCKHCNNTGYKGRIGIYEILENSEKI